jgi:hypothetical protein
MIKYKEVIDLGFKTEKMQDSIHIDEYGFDDINCYLYLTKRVYIKWEILTRKCTLVRLDNKKNMNILHSVELAGLQEVKSLIKIFGKKKFADTE